MRIGIQLIGATLGIATQMGCGASAHRPAVNEIEGIDTCKAARDPLNPYVVEWRGADLTDFEHTSKSGLVVVSYAGCTLKVLPRCEAGGDYTFAPTTRNRDSFTMNTTSDLQAELPLGVASLQGKVGEGRSLKLDYVAVGVRDTADGPTALKGSCEGATHYVQSITVGAFALSSGSTSSIGGGVQAGQAGASADQHQSVELLKAGGSVATCAESNADTSTCSALIRLGLADLPSHLLAPGSRGGDRVSPKPTAEASGLSWLVPVGFAVGGAGLLVGAITGGITASKASALDDECDGDVCRPDQESELDTALALSRVSTVSFVVAGVGIAGGVVALVVSAPQTAETAQGSPPPSPVVHLVMGPQSAGLEGSF